MDAPSHPADRWQLIEYHPHMSRADDRFAIWSADTLPLSGNKHIFQSELECVSCYMNYQVHTVPKAENRVTQLSQVHTVTVAVSRSTAVYSRTTTGATATCRHTRSTHCAMDVVCRSPSCFFFPHESCMKRNKPQMAASAAGCLGSCKWMHT